MIDAVALVSGGKDSCFSIVKAKSFGIRIVVLAHVEPPCDEPDSMMYQSVGSTVVPQIARSLGLPMISVKTNSIAKSTQLNYRVVEGDEVEDLVSLLADVRNQFPSVKYVISGALWSDYQRLRVENAASRVGLLSVAPLWRRQQRELLDEMIAFGLDAVLIKVAGIGLNDSHLGKTLQEMRPLLVRLENLYGCHVCGEGGEYETFVRWMPGFNYRIELTSTETIIHTDDPVAPVSYLRILSVSTSPIRAQNNPSAHSILLDRHALFKFKPVFYDPVPELPIESKWCSVSTPSFKSIGICDGYLHLALFTKNMGLNAVKDVCQQLQGFLSDRRLSTSNVVSVQLYLQQVEGANYVEANRDYQEMFGTYELINPPVRACVGLTQGNLGTTMEVLIREGRRDDAVSLHVQSLSEWAPACIGPYSQFVEEDQMIFISGALPLFPPSGCVPKGMPIENQTSACFENIRRTLEAARSKIENIGLFVVYVTSAFFSNRVEVLLPQIFPYEDNVKALLPVSSLPKGALVEVKAVGMLSSGTPRHKITVMSGSEMKLESISCGNFKFIVVTSWSENTRIEESIINSIGSLNPLAVHLYGRTIEQASEIERLQLKLPDTSITKFFSEWMPHDAQWIGIITLPYH